MQEHNTGGIKALPDVKSHHHLLVETIVEDEAVRQGQTVGLHWVTRTWMIRMNLYLKPGNVTQLDMPSLSD